jgi:hypothetical protein
VLDVIAADPEAVANGYYFDALLSPISTEADC